MYLTDSASSVSAFARPAPNRPPAAQWVETPLANGRFELKLWGKFPPRWLANLTAGLAARGLTIHQGYANKLSPTVWQGTFELSSLSGARLPKLDYVALAQQGENCVAAAAFSLDRVRVVPEGDALFVEVQGADSVGFLMTLLKTFAFYSLYPAEISIDTPAGRVHDRFWLKGMAGAEPSATAGEGLRQELEKHLGRL